MRFDCLFTFLAATLTAAQLLAAQPIRLHPDNPRWFEWRGKTIALIASGEHYGAVLNPDFDFRRYLETMQRDGMNYTRLFSGSYVEPPGAFGITRNTLAPAPSRFLAPWTRSPQPGYAGGGDKFDLDRFSPEYLARLKEFVTEAGRRGIVVELTLFCSTYTDQQWAVHPCNPTNNIQAFPVPDWKQVHTLNAHPAILERQTQLVRWLVRELNGFDNLFFEIQNEPWSDNHTMGDFVNPYMVEHHDYSFTVGREDGTDVENRAPGGGSPGLRRRLKVLSDFIHSFDLAKLEPNPLLIARAPGVVARVLSAGDLAHAIYLQGRAPTALELSLANGRWTAEWVSLEDGAVLKREVVKAGKPSTVLHSPDFTDAIALRLLR